MESTAAATERGIIFSRPMVLALLAGRKTQTRRLAASPLAKLVPGDRLWVREIWGCHWACDNQLPIEIDYERWSVRYFADDHIRPAADGSIAELDQIKKKRSPRFMPRAASRLTLTITDVRQEPLRAITPNDAIHEGVEREAAGWRDYQGRYDFLLGPRESFATLWDSLNPERPNRWQDNPQIVALTFTVERRNIDQ